MKKKKKNRKQKKNSVWCGGGYLVMDVAVLGLHDLDRTHLGVGHPLDVIGLLLLELRIIVLGVLQI